MKFFLPVLLLFCFTPMFADDNNTELFFEDQQTNCCRWARYDYCFGTEDVCISFPCYPYESCTGNTLTLYTYDYGVMYALTGYYPPFYNLDPIMWFDEVLYSYSICPYTLLSHVIYETELGDWILDYTVCDEDQNLIIKGHAVVTPFNAYTLKCVKSVGIRDSFDYFVDNFRIICECNH